MRQLKLLIAALFLISPFAANAIPITTSVGDYEVTLVEGNFDSLLATLNTQIWWDNESLAIEFAGLVQDSLGLPIETFLGDLGPAFAYSFSESQFNYAACNTVDFDPPCSVVTHFFGSRDPSSSLVFAVAEEITDVPEPGTLTLLGLGLIGMVARRRKTV